MNRRLYVACYHQRPWTVIRADVAHVTTHTGLMASGDAPTHPPFALIGPFRTRAAAELCAETGPHGTLATVTEFERAANATHGRHLGRHSWPTDLGSEY